MQMVAAPVAGIAVPSDPTPRHDRLVLPGLREMRELPDLLPGTTSTLVGDDVRRQTDRVLAVCGMNGVPRIPVDDEDVEAALHPADVWEEPAVDLLAGKSGDRHEPTAP